MAKINTITFEEALSMTGLGKFNLIMFLLSVLVVTGMAFEVFSVSYLVPASACELNTTVFQQGLIAGMPLIGIIATSHIWGYLADTKGRRKTLFWSMIFGFCAGFLATFSMNWIVLAVLKFISSAGLAGCYPLVITLLGETTPQNKRSVIIAFLNTQLFLGSGIMALLSIPVLRLNFSYYVPFLGISMESWRLLNFLFCLPCALSAISVFFVYESPRYLLKEGKDDEALNVLRAIFVINTGKSQDEYEVQSVTLNEDGAHAKCDSLWASFASQTIPMFKPPLLKSTLLLSTLFVIAYVGMQPFVIWMPFIADAFMRSLESGEKSLTFCEMLRYSQNQTVTESKDCSLNVVAMTSVFCVSLFLAIANSIFSTSVNLFGKKRLLIGFMMMSGTCAICINFLHNYIFSGILFTLYIVSAINFSFLSIYTVDIYPTYVKAMAVCLTLMVGRGSSAIGINVLKSLLTYDCELAFYLFGGLTLCGGLISFLLPTDNKKPKTVED
ncbi:unnamed protein product [Pieris brassicae]|uniref:Major facilitator superfamily (MFS) profile domain-containing protein n=1 Tax=Pieris brassicae TaxID=7116 RepID=A0A9P0X1L1_PIEBR|nr:unnamed protein product [Pieris brassicae]